MNRDIYLSAGTIVRRDDQRVLWRSCILTSYRADSCFSSDYLMHSALNVEAFDCCCDMTTRQHLHSLFQLRVPLTHNLIELHRGHPRFLKLREGAASLHAFMLTHIANQQHPIIPMKSRQELMHLPCGRQRRLVQHVKPLLSCVWS